MTLVLENNPFTDSLSPAPYKEKMTEVREEAKAERKAKSRALRAEQKAKVRLALLHRRHSSCIFCCADHEALAGL